MKDNGPSTTTGSGAIMETQPAIQAEQQAAVNNEDVRLHSIICFCL